jgi:hypothetical protein
MESEHPHFDSPVVTNRLGMLTQLGMCTFNSIESGPGGKLRFMPISVSGGYEYILQVS